MIELLKSVFLSPRGTISSKRLTGFLMITLAGFLIALGIIKTFYFDNSATCPASIPAIIGITCKDFSPNLTGLVRDLIYGGVALLSSTVFEKKFKSPENEQQ